MHQLLTLLNLLFSLSSKLMKSAQNHKVPKFDIQPPAIFKGVTRINGLLWSFMKIQREVLCGQSTDSKIDRCKYLTRQLLVKTRTVFTFKGLLTQSIKGCQRVYRNTPSLSTTSITLLREASSTSSLFV